MNSHSAFSPAIVVPTRIPQHVEAGNSYCITQFFVGATLGSMWDLTSPTRDEPVPSPMETRCLNHWTTRKLIILPFIIGCTSPLYPLEFFMNLFIGCARSKLLWEGYSPVVLLIVVACRGTWAPGHLSFCSCGSQGLQHGLSSCGTRP